MPEGTGFSLTPAPMGQMQAHSVGVTGAEQMQRTAVNGAEAIGGSINSVVKMMDYKARSEAMLKLRSAQQQMEIAAQKRLQAAPGTALSFCTADGSIDQEKVQDFVNTYKEAVDEIRPSFIDITKEAEYDAERNELLQNSMLRLVGQVELHEIESIKRAGAAVLKECELNNDATGYASEIRRQVAAGVLTEQEGRVKNLAFGKRRLGSIARSGGSVNIDGRDYSGFAAALAAEAARTGYKLEGKEDEEGEAELGGEVETMLPDSLDEPGVKKMTQETHSSVTSSDDNEIPITIYTEYEVPSVGEIDFGDGWVGGDFAGVVKNMSNAEAAAVQDQFAEPRITRRMGENGQVIFECPDYAPEEMKRLVAAANYNGGVSRDSMKALVASRAAGLLADDPDLSAENILKQFEGKGVFESLGDGDEEAGKTEAKIIVDGLKRLHAGNPDQLESKAVERAIELHVSRPSLGVRKDGGMEDWKAVEVASSYLLPTKQTKKGKTTYAEYGYPADDAVKQKRWVNLKMVYKRTRAEWNAELADVEYTDEEFKKNAGAFTAWYMSNKHDKARTATQNAERDYYRGKVAEEIQRGVRVDKDGNVQVGGYANQVSVLKTVLSQDSPLSDDVRAYLEVEGLREKTAREQRQKLRVAADKAKERLDAEARRQQEKKAAMKSIDAQEKEQQKKEQDAAKKRESQRSAMEQKRMKARRKAMRCESWGWDLSASGREAECTVPQAEIERIKALGWDGVQDVYLHVDGETKKRVRVRMEDGANGENKILFNHLGAAYLQPKKKKGKVQNCAIKGDFQYNYDFQ